MSEIRKYIKLVERYSEDNGALLRYFKNNEFDPYPAWRYVCKWIVKNDYLEELSELTGQELDKDSLEDEEPDLFYKLPKDVQKECAESVVDTMMNYDPAEVGSIHHMSLSGNKVLPRNTWLIHFTDDPYAISSKGFIYGVDQMDKLGLTTYFSNSAKKYGGYNFAFIANSRDAKWAASEGKYGKNAVIFQNAAIPVHHHSDEENQAIFWGKDVDPAYIVVLIKNEYEEDWNVKSKDGEKTLFRGNFDKAVEWVISHHQQYRKVLYKK